jgi:hypothetical protein
MHTSILMTVLVVLAWYYGMMMEILSSPLASSYMIARVL